MNFALGHAFTLDDVFLNFPYDKMKFNYKQAQKYANHNSKKILVKRIFQENVKMIIEDIIENNATFYLPVTGKVKANMHVKAFKDEEFKKLKKKGKWKGLDYLKSFFTGYQIVLNMRTKGYDRTKPVYISGYLRDRLIKYANEGKQYY